MTSFAISIAGHSVEVHALFESTRDYCRKYLTEEPPILTVTVTREDLEHQQAAAFKEARQEGLKPRVFTDPFLERTAIQCKIAEGLMERGILLLHGSAVAVDGLGYLFTARCGTGKSTHTRYWRETFGTRSAMINDDKPFLRFTEEAVLVCGAPWSGKHGLDTNIAVPLKGICILERGSEDLIQTISPEAALPMLYHQSQEPEGAHLKESYRNLVEQLALRIPLYRMTCTKNPRAALTAYHAMSPHTEGEEP